MMTGDELASYVAAKALFALLVIILIVAGISSLITWLVTK